jgi:hypothetical protein
MCLMEDASMRLDGDNRNVLPIIMRRAYVDTWPSSLTANATACRSE